MNLQLCQLSTHFIGIWLLAVVSYDPLYFCTVCCNLFFIFNLIDLSLLPRLYFILFLMSLANGLSISFIFSKNQLLVFADLCYSVLHFFSLYFCSNLYDFFPSTNFEEFFPSFSRCFRCKVRFLFYVSLVTWGRLELVWTSLLALLLLNPIGFALCFHCHLFLGIVWISFFIFSVICWLFRSMLFSLHVLWLLFFFISCRLITLQYCSGFWWQKHWHESAMDIHVFPIPIPPPTSLSTRSLWVFPVHQPRALVSCIQPGLVSCFTLDNIHV